MKKWVNLWSQHCKKPRGQFRWPDDCHAYIDCWNGSGRKHNCNPRTLVFNEALGRCDWPTSTPCINGDIEEEPADGKKEVDLNLPYCSNYTGLGYKCVNFWECSPHNEILDDYQKSDAEGVIDARMVPPVRKVSQDGVFDPLSKICSSKFEICCKGKCSTQTLAPKVTRAEQRRTLNSEEASSLCPAEFTGNRPIPGICTQFAECYKGNAIIKDCPPGLHFCIHSRMCDWPQKIVCDQLDYVTAAITLKQTQNDDPRGDQRTISSRVDLSMMARKEINAKCVLI